VPFYDGALLNQSQRSKQELQHRSSFATLARITTAAPAATLPMVGPPGSGSRRPNNAPPMATTVRSPRNVDAPSKTASNGRMTPLRIHNEESSFTVPNGAWGYETPTNKILSNVPSTITNRSSERRRRMKTDNSDVPGPKDKTLGPGFVESKFARARTHTFDSVAPEMWERSNSHASTKSEYGPQEHKLTKVSSFSSDRPLQPTNNKGNFFHANDYHENPPPPVGGPEAFFFASNPVKNISSLTSTNVSPLRRLSTSSQYSSFSTAKEACQLSTGEISAASSSRPIHQLRTPISSPTKPSFFHASSAAETTSPTAVPSNTMTSSSPLRPSFVTTQTGSPPLFTSPIPFTDMSQEPTSSSSNSSAPVEIPSDTSEDELATKSLLPSASDLENSARINRKVTFPSRTKLTQIADLEISNASLLAVNKGLERLTRQQSNEIKLLRKQLRQSLRLSTVSPAVSSLEDSASDEDLECGDESFGTEDDELDFRLSLDKSIFLTEQMLAEGRKGLEYRVRTSELPTGRVLSAEWKDGVL
jgi:hypothetical protein